MGCILFFWKGRNVPIGESTSIKPLFDAIGGVTLNMFVFTFLHCEGDPPMRSVSWGNGKQAQVREPKTSN